MLTLNIRGVAIVYDAGKREIRVARSGGADAARSKASSGSSIYADRTSLEVFADGGLIYVPLPHNFGPENTRVEVKVAERRSRSTRSRRMSYPPLGGASDGGTGSSPARGDSLWHSLSMRVKRRF